MTQPHKCPVCEGRGAKLQNSPLDARSLIPEPCHACKGAGVLWEPERCQTVRTITRPVPKFEEDPDLDADYYDKGRHHGRLDVIEWLEKTGWLAFGKLARGRFGIPKPEEKTDADA